MYLQPSFLFLLPLIKKNIDEIHKNIEKGIKKHKILSSGNKKNKELGKLNLN